jgi:hypothetical protein
VRHIPFSQSYIARYFPPLSSIISSKLELRVSKILSHLYLIVLGINPTLNKHSSGNKTENHKPGPEEIPQKVVSSERDESKKGTGRENT